MMGAKQQKREAQAAAKRRWPERDESSNPHMIGRRIARNAFRDAMRREGKRE